MGRLAKSLLVIVVCAAVVVGVKVVSGDASVPCDVPSLDSATPVPGSRLSTAAQQGMALLATRGAAESSAAAEASEGLAHNEHGPAPTTSLSDNDQAHLKEQLACAKRTAAALLTEAHATSAGYVQASTFAPGVGTHLVDWRQVGRPFDPARPAMLLFAPVRHGEEPQLVGLSYWVGAPTLPEGFAGGDDFWHQHTNLCFVDGWLSAQGSLSSEGGCRASKGSWVDGHDLWMLHVWVSPALANRWGTFAVLNPALCPPRVGTPDVERCNPDTE